ADHVPREEASPDEKPTRDDDSYRAAIGRFVSGLLESDASVEEAPDAVDLLTQSIDVMQGAIARLKLAAYAPDIVVDVPRDACSFFEFHRAEEMAELGYKNTIAALDHAKL
ncbi:MAG: hypothetical protein RLN69_16490, partial [Woeseiaceae bacterium]